MHSRSGDGEGKWSLPCKPANAPDAAWAYLEKSYDWYDRAARRGRVTFWLFKFMTMASAAVVTVMAAGGVSGVAVAATGAVGLLSEGLAQTGQFHSNYISYRLVAEGIHTMAWQFAQGSATNLAPEEMSRAQALMLNVTALINAQNGAWAERMQQAAKPAPGGAGEAGSGR
jgi:Protein of unknown function (DUF4231)